MSTHFPEHQHPGAELNLVMCGELQYRVGEREITIRAGQLLVLPPEGRHQLLSVSADAAFWVVELPAGVGPEWFQRSEVHDASSSWVKSFVNHMRKLWLRPDQETTNKLEGALSELWAAGPPLGDTSRLPNAHPAVTRARSFCERDTDEEFDVNSLAERAGLSAGRLARLFQEQLGLSPLQYRNYCRVQRFIFAEGSGNDNLMRAALRSGFGSYPQFHRTFRQVCGAPPGEHLQRLALDAWLKPERTLPARGKGSVSVSVSVSEIPPP